MIATAPVKNVGYYEDLASEDYYLQGGEPPGVWFGQNAMALGLEGKIEKEHFSNLMQGLSPNGKKNLTQNAGSKNRVAAYDNVFSPSKSVSIAWASASPDERQKIQEAHDIAVKAALAFIEGHAAYTRRGHNGEQLEKLSGLVIGTYQHSTSREQDMHLHTHAVVLNLGQREDGSWGSIVGRFLYTWRVSASAIYQCQLAKEIKALGYYTELATDGKSFNIIGIPQPICVHFSKRSKKIEEEMKKFGPGARASALGDKIARYTREKKLDIDRPALFSKWQRKLVTLGLNASELKHPKETQPTRTETVENFDVESLLNRLTEKSSVFREHELYREAALLALQTGNSSNQAQLLAQKSFRDERLISLDFDAKNNELFSTKYILAAENEMTKLAKELRSSSFGFCVLEKTVIQECNAQPFPISEEQKESAFESCLSNLLSIIQGSAGAGKTTLMKVVVDIHQRLGSKVIGAANTKAAALNLEEQTKIQGYTIARLLGLLDSSKPPVGKDDVLIVDEAGQLGTFQLLALMQHAKRLEFKLLLVGEDKQLDAIQHGGVLKYLSSPKIIGTTRIETIKRQNEVWDRQAVADFRDGYAEKALSQYARRNQIIFGTSHEETLLQMVAAWKNYISSNPDKPYLIIAHRWEVVKQLNAAARIHLKEMGLVGKEDILVNGVVSEKAMSFQVSIGERVRLTKNDYQKNFTNGHIGTVLMVKENSPDDIVLRIRLDSGRTIKIRTTEYCDEKRRAYLAPAYAQTVYSSQGLTISGQTFVHYSSSMDRANSYVACSRHKEKATIFANEADLEEHVPFSHQHAPSKKQQLIAAMSTCMNYENRPKLATEYLSKTRPKNELASENTISSEIIC
jgi:conjugative relaxase-like TrwC/TraI family protein